MDNKDERRKNIIDDDLYEEFEEEELSELLEAGRLDVIRREQEEASQPKKKRRVPKLFVLLIAFAMAFNVFALLPQTFSIPAIDFLIASAKLSTDKQIRSYKEAVVVIEAADSRGTGFSISSDGMILTNNHVIEGEDTVTVGFPKDGLFTADVVEVYPSIDLAVLEVKGENLPYLNLAEEMTFTEDEYINFIGNPLRFQGIANEGTIIDYIQLDDWEEKVVMIKAPVYRGNSGSPIINDDGEVIGVIFATLDHSEYGKVGLFIPIDYYYTYKEN